MDEEEYASDGAIKVSIDVINVFDADHNRHLPQSMSVETLIERIERMKEENRELYRYHQRMARRLSSRVDPDNSHLVYIAYLLGAVVNHDLAARQKQVNDLEKTSLED